MAEPVENVPISGGVMLLYAKPDGTTMRFASSDGRGTAIVSRDPQDLRKMAAALLRVADAAESPSVAVGIKTLVFRCDGLDACAIEAAIKVRANYAVPDLPDYYGDEDAATLAEACRAYLDAYGEGDAYNDAIKAAGLAED